MAHLVSYFVLSIILGISSFLNAENLESTKKVQPAYYTPDETSARDLKARDQTSRDYNTRDQTSVRDYSARDQTSARDYNTRDSSVENALPAFYNNNFDCSVHRYAYGMYADLDFKCQVYHVCHNNRKESFQCPQGTLFNQQILSCDHWYSVRCQDSPNFYHVNELLGKTSNRTYGGVGGTYSTRRFPASSYGQQGYGNSYSQNQLTPQLSERDQINGTRYGSNQVQRGIHGEYDRGSSSNGYGTQSQFGRPGQYGDNQIGSSGQSASQDSSWDRQTESPFDRQSTPTGSQSSLYDRRQPQPGYPGSSSFDTQRPLSGIDGPLSGRTRIQPGSSRPGYPYRSQIPSTGSQPSHFSRPQSGVDRFPSGRQSGSRGSAFDRPELRPGSFETVDEKQPDSRRYPYRRQPFEGGSTRLPFDRPESGVNRYPYGRQPSTQTSLGSSFDRPQSGLDRYPSGRHISQPGSRGSAFDRPSARPDFPSSSSDRTQPGSGRYPYGRQPFETGTRPGSDEFSIGRDPSEVGKPYGRPGSQPSPYDNRLTGRRFPYTTQRPSIGSEGYDVQKPLSFGGPTRSSNTTNQFSTYPRGTGFQDIRFIQPPRGYSGSQYNNLQSSNYGRGSGSGFQPQSHPLSRPETRGSQSWRYNQYSSQTSSEWATDAPLVSVPRDVLQSAHRPPGRLSNKNGTSVFGDHQKNLHVKDRNMLGQPSQQGESSVPSSDQEDLKPILVYQKHVPVPITKNSTESDDSKEIVTNEEVPAYKLYYVKEDQIKN